MKATDLTATELSSKIKSRELSVREATLSVLDKIDKTDGLINAYITVEKEHALARADQVQKQIDNGLLASSPIAGVPVSLKDNICTQGIRTTCASKMLENFIPPYNAYASDLLEQAGAIIIGKLNMDEFAMGSTTETSYFGRVSNPWNPDHTPGGSSGGCAAAIASQQAILSLGTDTGGSIRQPASMCGVSGFKPTYGTVSRYGLIAYASSMDQIGPIAKTVADCAACMDVIGKYDNRDSTCIRHPAVYSSQNANPFSAKLLKTQLKGLKIGLPRQYFSEALSDDVKNAVMNAADIFRQEGAEIHDFDLPITEYAISSYYLIACAEASSNLARYDGIRYGHRSSPVANLSDFYIQNRSQGFGSEVKNRILLGTYVLSEGYYDEYYKKALSARELIKESFCNVFKKYDVLLTPTAPSTAPKKGDSLNNPVKMYLQDAYTVSSNLAGLPALSIPCGLSDSGMPIGMQIIGNTFDDEKVLSIGYKFQQLTSFHKLKPGGAST